MEDKLLTSRTSASAVSDTRSDLSYQSLVQAPAGGSMEGASEAARILPQAHATDFHTIQVLKPPLDLTGANDESDSEDEDLRLMQTGIFTMGDSQASIDPTSYLVSKTQLIEKRVYREVIFVTTAVFMAYASLVVLQRKLYNRFEANQHDHDVKSVDKQVFEHGTSLIYFGNLLLRLLHNVVFAWLTPRNRVICSLLFGMLSMITLSVVYFWFSSAAPYWTYPAYLLGGVAIGTFEANLLSTITPLGHDTKVWAIIGMPLGFTSISLFGYMAMEFFSVGVETIYLSTAVCCFAAIFVWIYRIPTPSSFNQQSFTDFKEHLTEWRQWLPKVKWHCFSLAINMFFVSFFVALNQYVLGDHVPLISGGTYKQAGFSFEVFMMVNSLMTFMGDTGGRKIIYYYHWKYHPCLYLVLSVTGGVLCVTRIPLLMWFGMIFIFLGNGLIYAASARYVDGHIMKRYNLTCLSAWLFIGDIGSVTGSNTWQFLEPLVCYGTKNSKYFCDS